jgi:hypothetical protein
LEGLSFSKAYVEGRLSVLCDFEWKAGRYRADYSVADDLHGNVRHSKIFNRAAGSGVGVTVADDINTSQASNLDGWYDEDMLVLKVESVKIEECGSVSSNVWLYRLDNNVGNDWVRHLVFSLTDRCYKFVFCRLARKISSLQFYVMQAKDFAVKQIECGTQIVGRIADYERDEFGQLLSGPENQPMCPIQPLCPITRIFLNGKSIEVCLDKRIQRGVKLIDVMIGPFDL